MPVITYTIAIDVQLAVVETELYMPGMVMMIDDDGMGDGTCIGT